MIATALVAVPLVAAVLCTLPIVSRVARLISVLASLTVTGLAAAVFVAPLQVSARVTWAGALGASYLVDLDGLS